MAKIYNVEENVHLEITLIKNEMYDYVCCRSDYENWIPFILNLEFPFREISISESNRATMTVYELKKLVCGIGVLLEKCHTNMNYIYEFYSSEGYFEIKFDALPEDSVVEVELWINTTAWTGGQFYGFDEGIKFTSDIESINVFYMDIKKELNNLCK